MKTKGLISFILALSTIFVSCKKEPRYMKEVKDMIGSTITFPERYTIITKTGIVSHMSLKSEKIRIVTYIDGLQSCSECQFNALKNWEKDIEVIGGGNVEYVVIFSGIREEQLQSAVDKYSLQIPLVLCKTADFGFKNSLHNKLTKNKTFLLNTRNEIVLVGEPFNSEKLSQLYKQAIASLSGNGI